MAQKKTNTSRGFASLANSAFSLEGGTTEPKEVVEEKESTQEKGGGEGPKGKKGAASSTSTKDAKNKPTSTKNKDNTPSAEDEFSSFKEEIQFGSSDKEFERWFLNTWSEDSFDQDKNNQCRISGQNDRILEQLSSISGVSKTVILHNAINFFKYANREAIIKYIQKGSKVEI